MKIKKWIVSEFNIEDTKKLCQETGFPQMTTAVLCARGLNTTEKVKGFLQTDFESLYDPFLLKDMDKAVKQILESINNGEKIAVFGDYDVDGVTSTCVVMRYLKSVGADCEFYIPDRVSEGYGLNQNALLSLKNRGVNLVITVDSGITAVAEIDYANSIGLKVVVTDHHECKNDLPNAVAVVNPKRYDCTYPFKELAGVGVAFKLVCALAGKERYMEILNTYSDLVAIGTIADVMKLIGENRIIVTNGLKNIQRTKNHGLRMLMRESGVEEKKITSGIISFILAPRINAAGRLGCASRAAEMFLTDDIEEAQDIAFVLCQQNKERQIAENEILEQAITKIRKEYDPLEDKLIVLWGEDWHHGVIGIVSSRISDRYSCPAILISLDGEIGKGSGRSIKGFNLFEALEDSSEYLVKFGGHELAAGLTVERKNLEAFRNSIYEYADKTINPDDLMPVVKIDCALEPRHITEQNVNTLTVLEPYGMGNPQPVFCMENMMVEEIIPISSDKHLKMYLSKDGYVFTAMLFGTSSINCGFVEGNLIDVAFNVEVNEFRNKKTIQLLLKDAKLSKSEQAKDKVYLEMYSKYMDDNILENNEVERLLPDRSDLVAVWRHINSRAIDKRLSVPFNSLSRRIVWESKKDINIGKLFVCLDVFSESQLLSYNFKDDLLNIILKPYKGKADISQSVVLSTLKNMSHT